MPHLFRWIPSSPIRVNDAGDLLTFITVNCEGEFRLRIAGIPEPRNAESIRCRQRGETQYDSDHPCPECGGTRFRPGALTWDVKTCKHKVGTRLCLSCGVIR